jgi:hypothetical protein
MTTPSQQATLNRVRRYLDRGQHWWVDPVYAKLLDYAHAIDTLEAEGYPVDRNPAARTIRVDPKPQQETPA